MKRRQQGGDPAIGYVDGLTLYGPDDAPLPDQLHPDAATHHLIGERFAQSTLAALSRRMF